MYYSLLSLQSQIQTHNASPSFSSSCLPAPCPCSWTLHFRSGLQTWHQDLASSWSSQVPMQVAHPQLFSTDCQGRQVSKKLGLKVKMWGGIALEVGYIESSGVPCPADWDLEKWCELSFWVPESSSSCVKASVSDCSVGHYCYENCTSSGSRKSWCSPKERKQAASSEAFTWP